MPECPRRVVCVRCTLRLAGDAGSAIQIGQCPPIYSPVDKSTTNSLLFSLVTDTLNSSSVMQKRYHVKALWRQWGEGGQGPTRLPTSDGHGSQSAIPKPRRTRSRNGPVIFKSTPHTASYAIIAAGLHRRWTPRLRLATQCGTQGLSYSNAVNISLAKLCPLASPSYGRTFGHADWWCATRQ